MTYHDEDDDLNTKSLETGEPSVSHASTTGSSSFGRSDTRRVTRSKYIVAAVIFVAAILVGSLTFVFARNGEEDDFENQFSEYAVEIVNIILQEANSALAAGNSLSVSITSFALASFAAWPQVTVPDFELRGYHNNILSKALQVSLVPLVRADEKEEWEIYAQQNEEWIDEGLAVAKERQLTENTQEKDEPIEDFVWRFADGDSGTSVVQNGEGFSLDGVKYFAPLWQQSPAPHDTQIVNYDILSHPVLQRLFHAMQTTGQPVFSEAVDLSFITKGAIEDNFEHPHTYVIYPVFGSFTKDGQSHTYHDVVASLIIVLPFDELLLNMIPEGVNGIDVVMDNTCGQHFTYSINGPAASFLGYGDHHDPDYDYMGLAVEFGDHSRFAHTEESCDYTIHVYPTSIFEEEYLSSKPVVYTIVVVSVFVCTAFVFLLYDYLVLLRQRKVVEAARRTNKIVTALFPSNVRDRILKEADEQIQVQMNKKSFGFGAKAQLKDFVQDDNVLENGNSAFDSKPIADLFPDATVMFADIVGFTAWSSVREPTQVFSLLETVYHAFDEIARSRRVFKVETVGDCYVAVAGLPEARKDHAVVMARFARDCLHRMNDLTKKLELTLGPDTGDLSMRIGLHSGPVTAGVLRGDKSRFQLFGDTVNTASKIESSGSRNRIHLSTETASLLDAAGKGHWLRKREDVIRTKVKGDMQTYWLEVKAPSIAPTGSSASDGQSEESMSPTEAKKMEQEKAAKKEEKAKSKADMDEDKLRRLVDWNSDVLARLLRQIVAHRNAIKKLRGTVSSSTPAKLEIKSGGTVIDEVKEIIELPEYDPLAAQYQEDPQSIDLGEAAQKQLRDYVMLVATFYRDNPFHNFEHASHVTMSVVKLLSRIIAPDWNERLFHEMYDAWRNGRSEKDPSEFWYNGEIGFFDFYIIPLAKKLKECGVFGVSSDEYLNYAQKNRAEWEAQGHQVVEKLVEKYTAEYANHQVRLDDIQDADHVPLRSRMFRSDTLSDDEGFLAEVEKQIDDEDGELSEKSQEDLVARASSRLTRGASKEKL
ncbi:hypothetical protein FisN_2Lu430 [Fistulifera solaris]|uniref:Guanylate cyclase domain-containing protein n=1 Tax=Fistulifera solaris TaxID=1519565 RepID=A0A1Z5JP92_FISSO|nr:hypothetical protein FisN_2Lu430 [Fistulifera solaris]|eukprot:GAX15863.1 hypothetical protein FisN_2Lu430 [Fistulifera solaris]